MEDPQIGDADLEQFQKPLIPISLGDTGFHANTECFQGLVPLLPHLRPLSVPKGGGGMWGIFGKPLKSAIWNTLGLHAVLRTCLRFLSLLDSVCASCCLFLSTGSYYVYIQIHVLLLPPMHHKNLWCATRLALPVQSGCV